MSARPFAFEGDARPENERYRLLLEITDVVARAQRLQEAMSAISAPMLALTSGDLLNLSLYDQRHGDMRTRYWKRNEESGEFVTLPVEKAASGWVWKNQKPVMISDTERERRFPEFTPLLLDHGIRSYVAVPVTTPSSRFGALALGRTVPQASSDDDVALLSRIATLGAVVLEKDRVSRAFEEQQSLVAISREVSSILELDKLLPAILFSLRSIARYQWAVLSRLDEDGTSVLKYGDGPELEPFVNPSNAVPLEQALSGRAIQTREVVFYTGEDLHQVEAPLAKAMCELGMQSVCSVPLIARNQVWGALNVADKVENAFGTVEVEYLEQVANQFAIALQNAQAYGEIADLKDRLTQEKRYLEYEIRGANRADEIVGVSPALKRVMDYAAIVADTDSTVLITGETGTGKERIARMIHGMSRRKERSFIKVNCAAIPTGLLESELFGHERGAFTGAVSQKIGRLELADKGTLLLDEVGEIPLELQPKLLRVLQDQEFERLGGTKTIRVDVRLIAATNRDLVQAMEEKEFRGDLFYRLHVFPLHLPALRERREDIPMLVRHFVEKCAVRLHKRVEIIPDDVLEVMMNWKWPGNIRELENFVERSVILTEGNRLTPPLGELREESVRQLSESDVTLRDKERQHIIEVLRQTRGVLSGPSGAAARLGVKRTTLQYKMQRLGISRTDYLN